ncbi:MAG: filamentous hemagglutinin N-terminal domain-containing protein, partial [Candidatus Omnitrophota bacterium]|nr:filamentous hemagglutinin N-terminal domain-containing protein [Candidatus Omnitrophota bacterium]
MLVSSPNLIQHTTGAGINTMLKKLSSVFSLVLVVFMIVSPVYALPQGQSVESGTATFEQPDSSTLRITAADKTVINFNSFNIAQNESVYFIQPQNSSSVLNRVNGGTPSVIAGLLNANGILFLVNPSGIRFTPTAQVQAAGLIASTLDIATNNFIKGNYLFEHRDGEGFAQVLNEGSISADNVALIASAVGNSGIILASAGTVNLAAGDKTTVAFDARGLIQVEVNSATSAKVFDSNGVSVKDAVANSGTIQAREVYMSASTANDIFENAVNQTGIVRATLFKEENGIIKIVANHTIQISGELKAEHGQIKVSSADFVNINSEFKSIGDTEIDAFRDISVNANFSTNSGNLKLIADSDLDGQGAFKQAKGTFISTLNTGDITIQASGESTLANINSAGDLILKAGGSAATFNQWTDSSIVTAGSLIINPQV